MYARGTEKAVPNVRRIEKRVSKQTFRRADDTNSVSVWTYPVRIANAFDTVCRVQAESPGSRRKRSSSRRDCELRSERLRFERFVRERKSNRRVVVRKRSPRKTRRDRRVVRRRASLVYHVARAGACTRCLYARAISRTKVKRAAGGRRTNTCARIYQIIISPPVRVVRMRSGETRDSF